MDIEANFERYLSLIDTIDRPGFKKETFINMLRNSDFATAPASTKFHNNFPGGLCAHCLNVYDNLVKLVEMKSFEVKDPNTLVIVALLHDLGKINFYKIGHKNVKYYCSKEEFEADPKAYRQSDEAGNFKWVVEDFYTVQDIDKRLIYGNHEETSEYIARSYVPLRAEESVAILHHMGGLSADSVKEGISEIYRRFPITMLLFEADLMATILDEVVI